MNLSRFAAYAINLEVDKRELAFRVAQLTEEAQTLAAHCKDLEAENESLRRQCHDHDRRRESSMMLARTLAEQPDLGMSDDWPQHGTGSMDAGCRMLDDWD